MKPTIKSFAVLIPLFLLAPLSACASMGSWQDILRDAGGYSNDVSGEVQFVDTRRQEIEVRSGWGRNERVRYDGRTEVVYQNRRYRVRDLERGDRVYIRLDDRSGRDAYARTIHVEESRSARNDDRYRVERVEGMIRYVGDREGAFQIETRRDGLITVYLGDNPRRADRDRFRKLRRGDRVSVEGVYVSDRRMVLDRFR